MRLNPSVVSSPSSTLLSMELLPTGEDQHYSTLSASFGAKSYCFLALEVIRDIFRDVHWCSTEDTHKTSKQLVYLAYPIDHQAMKHHHRHMAWPATRCRLCTSISLLSVSLSQDERCDVLCIERGVFTHVHVMKG